MVQALRLAINAHKLERGSEFKIMVGYLLRPILVVFFVGKGGCLSDCTDNAVSRRSSDSILYPLIRIVSISYQVKSHSR